MKKGSHSKRVCKTKSVTGSTKFVTAAKASAVVSRHGLVYATGTKVAGHGGDTEFVLSSEPRPLVSGSYKLTVRLKDHGRWRTTTSRIVIG